MSFSVIDGLYISFWTIGIYIYVLFIILYFENKGKFDIQKKIKYFPLISIIVPAHNEEKTIKETLESIRKLNWPKDKLEVIVVDDGSTDRTAEIVSQFHWIKLIKKENGGKASALNVGIKNSKGSFVACVDADSYPDPNALINMFPYFQEDGVAAVTSNIIVRSPKRLIEKLQAVEYSVIAWNRKLLEFIDAIYVTPGPLSIYRKDALEKIGLFDEKCLTEDIEVTWRLQRAGYKIRASISAKVYTNVPSKIRFWWKQRLRWNLGGEQTLLKHSSAFFDKNRNKVKTFIAPYQLFSYLMSILGISTAFYLFGKVVYKFILFGSMAHEAGLNLVEQTRTFAPVFLPNIFMIFGLFMFVCALLYVNLAISSSKHGNVAGFNSIRNVIRLLMYLSLYIMIFPFILLHSFWRLATRQFKW